METDDASGQVSPHGAELPAADPRPTDLVPYQRGVSLSHVAKGTFGRFLPGSVVGMTVPALVLDFMGPGGPLSFLDVILVQLTLAAPLVLGFGLGLLALGGWLYPDADVSGRRSFIAGLVSPVAVLAGSWISGGFSTGSEGMVVTTLVGVILALVMYFAWLSPTPEEMRDDRHEPHHLGPESGET
jgi:hypothetical protein